MIRPSQDDGISTGRSTTPPSSKVPRKSSSDSGRVGPKPALNWNWKKTVGSLLIALHLLAIAIAPASVPPSSPTIQNGWLVFQPYLQIAFLNHGYHYFAPDPGASSLIEYTVVTEDGERIWGRIPDRDTIWPRLLYHRHFMLTEFYGGLPPAAAEMRQAVAESYAQQLLHQHQGVSVELSHVVHQLSSRQEIIAGGRLDDPHKYEYTALGTFSLQSTATQTPGAQSAAAPEPMAESESAMESPGPNPIDAESQSPSAPTTDSAAVPAAALDMAPMPPAQSHAPSPVQQRVTE